MKNPCWIGIFILFATGFSFADCKRAKNDLNESKLLFALGDDLSKLDSWSPDLITRIVVELRGPYLGHCEDPKLEEKANRLEGIYLKKLLGVEIKEKERGRLFRGLLTLKDDFERTTIKLKKEKIEIKSFNDLKKLYGSVGEYKGVVIVSESSTDFAELIKFFDEVSEKAHRPSLLVDSSALFKILVTNATGVAAYIPEVAILVLSKDLLQDMNALKKLVILHELGHIAEYSAWNRERFDWKAEFTTLTGWENRGAKWEIPVAKKKRTENDILTTLSPGSPYSILPDDRVWSVKGKQGVGGLVFAKSYSESMKRNDPSEDLADVIAAYYIAPERFCEKKKDFARARKIFAFKRVWKFEIPSCN